MKRSFILLLLPLLFISCSKEENALPLAQLPAVEIELSSDSPKIGEPIELQIKVSAAERLVLPPIQDWLDPALEVVEKTTEETVFEDRWVQEQNIQLVLFQVTNLVLFADSKVSTLDAAPTVIDLPFQRVEVNSVLTDENQDPKFGDDTLPDFRGPEAIKRQKRNLLISAVAGLLVFIAVGLILWILARRPKTLPPPIPPHLIANRKIEALVQSEIWQRPDVDASAVALSLILRKYIEGKFEIRAPELTTEEFLENVEAYAPWPQQNQESLAKFFDVTDQIKFAGSRPGSEVLTELLDAAKTFIETTQHQEDAA